VSAYRVMREELERAVLPLASSLDGLTFQFQASLHDLPYRCGGYVVIEVPDGPCLAQVVTISMSTQVAAAEVTPGTGSDVVIRYAEGTGTVLQTDVGSFHDAFLRPARSEEVAAWLATQERTDRARLTVGEYLMAPGVAAVLDSGGFARHTFVCGQSGSGKTYSLGLLLERVLAQTSLRMVVLDPNSDYVGLGSVLEGAPPEAAAGYAHVVDEVAVWGGGHTATHQLRLRFAELLPSIQATVLGLDPIADRDEYAEVVDLVRAQREGTSRVDEPDDLLTAESPQTRRLGQRASNLGVLDWDVWGPRSRSLLAALRSNEHRCTIVDLGSLATVGEQRLVAQAGPVDDVGAARRADPLPARRRRGPQHPASRAGRRHDPALDRSGDPDRGRRAQVRVAPNVLFAAAAQGARERRLAVRQPGADADELPSRHR
jgi:hypothetical protein